MVKINKWWGSDWSLH